MILPRFRKVTQRPVHATEPVADPESAVQAGLAELLAGVPVHSGESVAIAVGSRGIGHLAEMVRGAVAAVRDSGGSPFIVPSMGSHGGATAEGQAAVLRHLGVTPGAVGCPVRSSMETVRLGETEDGIPIVFDKAASEANHIVVINRVKPHTIFSGPHQSGLLKMLLIGLGKHEGALAYHSAARRIPFERLIRTACPKIIEALPVRGGVAIVEDAHERPVMIRCLPAAQFLEEEPALLELAERLMPLLPVADADLLIIDEMGKNISGTGMDTNVLGRKHWSDYGTGEHPSPGAPARVFVRSLTKETAGNAAGIGLADFTLRRLVQQIDFPATYANAVTATRPRGAMLPMTFDTDEEAISQALLSLGVQPEAARIVRVRSTLHLTEVWASEPALAGLRGSSAADLSGPFDMEFDADGMLTADRIGGD